MGVTASGVAPTIPVFVGFCLLLLLRSGSTLIFFIVAVPESYVLGPDPSEVYHGRAACSDFVGETCPFLEEIIAKKSPWWLLDVGD